MIFVLFKFLINELSGYFRDNVIKTTEWVISSDFDAYWDFEELANTQQIVCSDDDVVSVMKSSTGFQTRMLRSFTS